MLLLAHAVPGGKGVWVQPVVGLQASVVQLWLSLQFIAAPGMHVPAWHLSGAVQALLSLQGAPSIAATTLHLPVDGAQVPGRWQASLAVQVTGLLWTHLPPWQVSAPLQRSVSAVQALPLQQAWPRPPHLHVPPEQVRFEAQALPAVQQGWPLPPQGWQAPLWQVPDRQAALPAQQG
jgi:hypothetical protein